MPRTRAKPKSVGRCCWVCGKMGGAGFTKALEFAGYEVKRNEDGAYAEIGYAHPNCMASAMRKAAGSPSVLSRLLDKKAKPSP